MCEKGKKDNIRDDQNCLSYTNISSTWNAYEKIIYVIDYIWYRQFQFSTNTVIDFIYCVFNQAQLLCLQNKWKFATNKLIGLSNSIQIINKSDIFKGRNLPFRIICVLNIVNKPKQHD